MRAKILGGPGLKVASQRQHLLECARPLRPSQDVRLSPMGGGDVRTTAAPGGTGAPPVRLSTDELRRLVQTILSESNPLPDADPSGDEVLTRRQVAQLLSVNEQQVSKLIRRGLPHHRPNGLLRFFLTEVLAWMKTDKGAA